MGVLCHWHVMAQTIGVYQRGTVVRMRMSECLPDHGIVSALAGHSQRQGPEACPEYTLLGEKAVYIMVGKSSNDVLPLAELLNFRLRKNEIAVRADDATRETRFLVREMLLREDWERQIERLDAMRGMRSFSVPMVRPQ